MKCIGQPDSTCENAATTEVDFGDRSYALCEGCRKAYDRRSRRNTGKPLEAQARAARVKVS